MHYVSLDYSLEVCGELAFREYVRAPLCTTTLQDVISVVDDLDACKKTYMV